MTDGTYELRNYTGHPLTITQGNRSVKLRPLGRAKINSDVEEHGSIQFDGLSIPLLHLKERTILNLPDPEPGVVYIVSGIVATAAQREDVVAPSRVVREGRGRVTECRALVLPSPMDKENENGKA